MINRTEPTVLVTAGDSTTSNIGDVIEFTATYPAAVTVAGTGTPSIAVNVDGTTRQATYVAGTGTTALRFQYEVQPGDEDTDGIAMPAAAIALNGATITDAGGDVVLTFQAPVLTTVTRTGTTDSTTTVIAINADGLREGMTVIGDDIDPGTTIDSITQNGPGVADTITLSQAATSSATGSLTFIGVLVDGVVPTVLNAIGPPAGTYGSTNELDITVTFSEAVTVTGTPTIPLTIGGQVRPANYNAGDSTSTVLVFRYPIASTSDVFASGTFNVGDINLNGGTIQDAAPASNDADLTTFVAPTITGVMINRTEPTVLITTGGNGSSSLNSIGDVIEFTATYPAAVTVAGAGTPSIAVNVDGTTRQATYVAGTGTTALRFQYEVQAGDEDTDGISMPAAAIALNGATITDAGGDVVLTFQAPVLTTTQRTNATTNATTTVSAINADGLRVGMIVTGNGLDPTKTYTIESIGEVGAGAVDTITLSEAATDSTVGAVTLTFTGTVVVDGIVPEIVATAPPAPGDYESVTNKILTFSLTFNEAVEVTGTPSIPLTIGGQVRQATYDSNTSTGSVLNFTYTVASSDLASGTFNVGNIVLNGGTIQDEFGNDADLTTFVAPAITGVMINRTEPTVTVTAGDSTTSNIGDVIEFTATYPAAVTVAGTGTPSIAVNVDGTTRQATYVAGTGTKALRFQYEVQPGDEDTDGISMPAAAIALNGATITDAGGDVVLTFSAPTLTGAKVDATDPSVAISSNVTNVFIGDTATITFTLTKASTDFVLNDVVVTGGTIASVAVGCHWCSQLYTAVFTPDD